MIIYAANGSRKYLDLHDRHPDHLGLLITPAKWRNSKIRWAMDNGAWKAFKNKEPWNEKTFLSMIEKAKFSPVKPEWVVVPDAVSDRKQTLILWKKWAPRLFKEDFRIAFAVQDKMTEKDVPPEADLIFVGGSTEWKWITLASWALRFSRVHVARVNTIEGLWRCHNLGVESCDGTGFNRSPGKTMKPLLEYLSCVESGSAQRRLFHDF